MKAGDNRGKSNQMVRTERLELSHLAAPEPKSGVSTNSTTSANLVQIQKRQAVPGVFAENGVDDGDRTHDTRSHNPVLYQLSYAHHYSLLHYHNSARFHYNFEDLTMHAGTPGRIRTCDHPLRRRVLYPAELRAPYVHIQSRRPEMLEPYRLPNRLRCVCEAGRIILSPHPAVNARITFFSNI